MKKNSSFKLSSANFSKARERDALQNLSDIASAVNVSTQYNRVLLSFPIEIDMLVMTKAEAVKLGNALIANAKKIKD